MTHDEPTPRSEETRLDSWKAIAAHLKRDVRTVRRWETFEGLPVHRHLHHSQSTVYAYTTEIDAWSVTRQPRHEDVPALRRPIRALAFAAVLTLSLLSTADTPFSAQAGAAQQGDGRSAMTTRRVWSPAPDSLSDVPSTDGRSLIYGDKETGHLVVRNLATGENRHFTNKGPSGIATGAADYPLISPDGQQAVYAFWGGRYDLRLVPLSAATSGAPPRILLSNDDVGFAEPEDWSPDGKQILAALDRKDKTTQLALISVADGSVRVLKTLDWRWPTGGRFSPDGRYVAYGIQLTRDSPNEDIFVMATDGSREATLVAHPAVDEVLGWSPDGKRILFASDRTGNPGAWSIEVVEGRPHGVPELIKSDIGNIAPLVGSTRDGALYYLAQTGTQDIYIASLDPAEGNVTVPPAPMNPRSLGGGKLDATWSPDGQYLAYRSRSSSAGPLRIRSMMTNEERDLSPNFRLNPLTRRGRLKWSPDGRFLLAPGTDDKNRRGLAQIDAHSGAVISIVVQEQGQGEPMHGVWSADGKAIFYVLSDPSAVVGSGIRVRDLETGRDREVYRPALASSISWDSHLALSPDGRRLAFVSNRQTEMAGNPANEQTLLVIPATGGDPRELLKVHKRIVDEWNGLASIEWTRDGNHVLYSWNRELWKISVMGGEAQRLGLASTAARLTSVSVHPDGQRIAFAAGDPTKQEVWVMENFWPAAAASR
jgi:Tol biopolymer transport system component